jgi:hypothetical protein
MVFDLPTVQSNYLEKIKLGNLMINKKYFGTKTKIPTNSAKFQKFCIQELSKK